MTGPVGRPVGEPFSGSSDTASAAPSPSDAASSAGMARPAAAFAGSRPSECGLPSLPISQAWALRSFQYEARVGTNSTARSPGRTVAVNRTSPSLCSRRASSVGATRCSGMPRVMTATIRQAARAAVVQRQKPTLCHPPRRVCCVEGSFGNSCASIRCQVCSGGLASGT